jgi:phage tail-like protein
MALTTDPYDDFRFRVKWDGQFVVGVSKVSGLKRSTEVVERRDGGDPSTSHKSPGRSVYEAITLERGRTSDTAFENWANAVQQISAGVSSGTLPGGFRKDIIIDLMNESGQLVMSFDVYQCWPSSYEALSGLDSNDTAVVVERITLEHEGWTRDLSVVPPTGQ